DGFLSHRLFQVRAGSTLSDTYEQEMGVPQGSILSPVLFSLKINNIVKSVLKGSEASLFVDDFALCIRAKFLPHAQRLMQLCVNSVQDWISNNGFKFSTSKTVCMHFCNQRKHFAEPSILLDKTPIKVVTEAKFLGVIFDRTLSYSSHVNYLKTNCLKALDIL
ncbi:reverse transcriptase domain-containing protein, partial [Thiolapillus sp.]